MLVNGHNEVQVDWSIRLLTGSMSIG